LLHSAIQANLSFLISDVRALRRSGLSAGGSECQKLNIVWLYGAEHSKFNHAYGDTGFKGLSTVQIDASQLDVEWSWVEFQGFMCHRKLIYRAA